MKFSFLFILVLMAFRASGTVESTLIQDCGKKDIPACVKLGSFYLKQEQWEKALLVGEALCGRQEAIGCSFAGTSLLAQGKVKEGTNFLSQGCDSFDPYSCRSLGRMMEKAGEKSFANSYYRRACHFGLQDICQGMNKARKLYGPHSLDFIRKINQECADTSDESCQVQLKSLEACSAPLNKEDCFLLAGYLSVHFRAKLIQSEAKAALLSLHAAQKNLREKSRDKKFSYDLSKVLKEHKPLDNYRYVFGFMPACGKKFASSQDILSHSEDLFPESYLSLNPRTKAAIFSYFNQGKPQDCESPESGFEAFAVASLDPFHPGRLDVWKIDQYGRIKNVTDGLPLP